MDRDRYAVILRYDPQNLQIHGEVVACLSRIDPAASERFDKIDITGRVIVKRSTDLATAKRLKHLLQTTGARCAVQKVTSESPPAPGPNRKATNRLPQSGRKTAPLLITCPNCGHQQLPEPECRACGIIISKARPRGESARIETPSAHKPVSRLAKYAQILNTAGRYTRPMIALSRKIQNPMGTRELTGWVQRAADRFIRCGLAFIIALVFEVGLLGLGKMMWFLYISTAVGQYYLKQLPEKAATFQRIVHADSLALGWDTTLTALYVGLLLAGSAQILHLIRYLYDSQGIIGRLILWFLPSTGVTAWIISQQDPFPEYALACTLAAVPTLCVLPSCLYLARTTLPELGDLRKIIFNIVKKREITWKRIIKKIRIWIENTKQAN